MYQLYLSKGPLQEKVKDLGYQPDKFGLYSLRVGGASAAANARVPDHLFKQHGHWKSENSKGCYVQDSLEKRLEVSKNIGLYQGYNYKLQL